MKRNILATVSAAALLLAAGSALAGNTSTVNQDANSTNVSAAVNQNGTGNKHNAFHGLVLSRVMASGMIAQAG